MYRNMASAFICALLEVSLYYLQMDVRYREESLVLQVCLLAYVFDLTVGYTRGIYGNESKKDYSASGERKKQKTKSAYLDVSAVCIKKIPGKMLSFDFANSPLDDLVAALSQI